MGRGGEAGIIHLPRPRVYRILTLKSVIMLTADSMAGSWGVVSSSVEVLGISLTTKSLMSLPRNMINSYVSFLGGIDFGAGRSSVPKERTVNERERERERERYNVQAE